MATLTLSKVVAAPLDKVWDIVGDIDREPEFWHGTKSIRNLGKKGNTVERDVVIAFKNSVCREIVQLDPKERINTEILNGPIKGTKTLTLSSIDGNTTTITVNWNVELSGIYKLFSGMVRKHIHKGTEEALERISQKLAQNKQGQ
ncbi:MAG TPA: SRPBCC family protein [Nitrososphaeraceae archaeon]|jgi:ribosome-associated toxin RatA of RatAB toxin-antitoxin module|nr:SRPBCC family protein [Nitrososphaeraceae archaeon]